MNEKALTSKDIFRIMGSKTDSKSRARPEERTVSYEENSVSKSVSSISQNNSFKFTKATALYYQTMKRGLMYYFRKHNFCYLEIFDLKNEDSFKIITQIGSYIPQFFVALEECGFTNIDDTERMAIIEKTAEYFRFNSAFPSNVSHSP